MDYVVGLESVTTQFEFEFISFTKAFKIRNERVESYAQIIQMPHNVSPNLTHRTLLLMIRVC